MGMIKPCSRYHGVVPILVFKVRTTYGVVLILGFLWLRSLDAFYPLRHTMCISNNNHICYVTQLKCMRLHTTYEVGQR